MLPRRKSARVWQTDNFHCESPVCRFDFAPRLPPRESLQSPRQGPSPKSKCSQAICHGPKGPPASYLVPKTSARSKTKITRHFAIQVFTRLEAWSLLCSNKIDQHKCAHPRSHTLTQAQLLLRPLPPQPRELCWLRWPGSSAGWRRARARLPSRSASPGSW